MNMGKRSLMGTKRALILIAGIAFVVITSGGVWAEPPPAESQPSLASAEEKAGEENESLRMLSGYLSEAALQNPELESAFYRWKAALEKVPQVNVPPDPRFTFAYYIESVETRVGPQRARLALAQTFPWFGVLDLKEDIALQDANAAKAQYDAVKLKIFYDIKNVFYEYAFLAQAIETTRQDVELIRYLESVARARYRAAATPYADVIRTQVQLGRLEDRLKTLRDLRKPTMAKLAATLNLAADTEFPWPPSVPVMLVSMSDEELITQLLKNNPQLKRYEYLEAREKSGTRLAQKDYFPEFTFGVETIITDPAMVPTTPDSGKDAVIASVTLNIPFWWEKRRAAVREGEAKEHSTERSGVATKQALLSDVQLALYKYRDAQRKIDLYQNALIPKAEESLAVTLEAFQAGIRSSIDLIDAENSLLEFELSYIRALADQAQRLAELEMLVGVDIPCTIHGVVFPKHVLPNK
jgi:outer membrane protein, heavy metal efflux system